MVIAYQVYELDKFRREMWAMRPQRGEWVKPVGPSSAVMMGQLGKQNLMGRLKQSAPSGASRAVAVDTNLKLELMGTIRGSPDGRDSALIQAKGKETKRYYLGDQIEGGSILDAVNDDHVSIKRGGKLEVLRYSKAEQSSAAYQPVVVQDQQDTSNVAAQPQPAAILSAEEEAAWKKPNTARERLKLRQQLIKAKQTQEN